MDYDKERLGEWRLVNSRWRYLDDPMFFKLQLPDYRTSSKGPEKIYKIPVTVRPDQDGPIKDQDECFLAFSVTYNG
ncbi:hypothetical protein TNCV_898421 [Trichonephila clavipes]|nr:hypothetical protein TNCV_898421 [Trichonephila clavipes]